MLLNEFLNSCSNNFIQLSALILSPSAIALQNMMYSAKSLVQFLLSASSLASRSKVLLLLLALLLLSSLSRLLLAVLLPLIFVWIVSTLLRGLSQSHDSIHPVNRLDTHHDTHPLNLRHRLSQHHGKRMEVVAILGFFPECCCSFWIRSPMKNPLSLKFLFLFKVDLYALLYG